MNSFSLLKTQFQLKSPIEEHYCEYQMADLGTVFPCFQRSLYWLLEHKYNINCIFLRYTWSALFYIHSCEQFFLALLFKYFTRQPEYCCQVIIFQIPNEQFRDYHGNDRRVCMKKIYFFLVFFWLYPNIWKSSTFPYRKTASIH